MKYLLTAALATTLAAAPAFAETTAADHSAHAAKAATPATPATAAADGAPATPATPAVPATPATITPATITDAELDQFAGAALKVNAIGADAALDAKAKQAAMVEAVTSSGLDPNRFNDIATLSQKDESLKTRLTAAFARQPAAPAAAGEQPGG